MNAISPPFVLRRQHPPLSLLQTLEVWKMHKVDFLSAVRKSPMEKLSLLNVLSE